MFENLNSIIEWGDVWGDEFNLLIFIVLYLFTRSWVKKTRDKTFLDLIIPISLILIFFEFSFWGGDWLHYYEILQPFATNKGSMEDIYYQISEYVEDNYLLWRLVVWGTSLILIGLTLIRLNLDPHKFWALFVVVCLLLLSYGRFTLALSIATYGYSYIIKPFRYKLLSFILGLSIIFLSITFHRSAVVFLLILALSYIPLNKVTIKLILGLIPISFILINIFGLSNLVLIFLQGDTVEFSEKFISYSEGKALTPGPVEYFIRFFEYGGFYLVLYMIVINVINGNYANWSMQTKGFARFILWDVAVASIFLLSTEIASVTLFYRIVYFTTIAIAIFLSMESWTSTNLIRFKRIYGFFLIYDIFTLSKWLIVPFLSVLYHM